MVGFVARQAGSASAFIPVIKECQRQHIGTINLGFEHAVKIWKEAGISSYSILDYRGGKNYLDKTPDLKIIITGTSENPSEDGEFWDYAKREKIFSMGYVESWVNYWQRFTINNEEGAKFNILPDVIGVVDNLMKDRLVQSGCAIKGIRIMGHPGFDEINRVRMERKERPVQSTKDIKVLFVSDALTEIYGSRVKDIFGYQEIEILNFLVKNLNEITLKNNQRIILSIRPHPRENISKFRDFLEQKGFKSLKIEITTQDKNTAVLNSDIVVGINSILLYEAAIMGKPVISIQLDRKIPSDNTDGRNGIKVFTERSGAEQFLNTQLLPLKQRYFFNLNNVEYKNSTERFMKLIKSLDK